MRGVANSTPACDQYTPTEVQTPDKTLLTILDKTSGRREDATVSTASVCVTSGCLVADLALGGGIPPGKVHTKAGHPHAGKTTDYFESMGDCLARRIVTYVFDAETAIDWTYGAVAIRKWGVELEWDARNQSWTHPCLKLVDFPSGDDWFRFMAWVLKTLPDYTSGPPQVAFFCDSAANLTPKSLADNPDSNPMAAQARMFGTGFHVVRSLLKRKGGVLFFTNHIKVKPGVVFGSPEYMTGGSALHHHSDTIEWMSARSSGMPQPAVKAKGRRIEQSWRLSGKDFFVYAAHAFKKNRRRGSATDQTWSRICFKESGGGGSGVDRAYDVFQFLCMTGQAEWVGRERVTLNVQVPTVVGDTKEIVYKKAKKFYGVSMSWVEFRRLVYEEAHDPGTYLIDLHNICRQQMATGWAFEQYKEFTKDIE